MKKPLLLIPAFIGIAAALRKAFSKATDDIANEFGEDHTFVPAEWKSLHPVETAPVAGVLAQGGGGGFSPIDGPAVHMDAKDFDFPFHDGSI